MTQLNNFYAQKIFFLKFFARLALFSGIHQFLAICCEIAPLPNEAISTFYSLVP